MKVRPAGESDLTIKYTDHEPREYWLDCYIEPYDRGSSRFAVYSDGRVDADILIRGLPGWLGVFGE